MGKVLDMHEREPQIHTSVVCSCLGLDCVYRLYRPNWLKGYDQRGRGDVGGLGRRDGQRLSPALWEPAAKGKSVHGPEAWEARFQKDVRRIPPFHNTLRIASLRFPLCSRPCSVPGKQISRPGCVSGRQRGVVYYLFSRVHVRSTIPNSLGTRSTFAVCRGDHSCALGFVCNKTDASNEVFVRPQRSFLEMGTRRWEGALSQFCSASHAVPSRGLSVSPVRPDRGRGGHSASSFPNTERCPPPAAPGRAVHGCSPSSSSYPQTVWGG